MTATIQLQLVMDGPRPDEAIIYDALERIIPGVILSEEIDGTDDWAIEVGGFSIEVED
jgi:hypothetical protein